MTFSKTLPTVAGEYWWCDGVTERTYIAFTDDLKDAFVRGKGWQNIQALGGYWRLIDPKDKPAAYIEPKRPEVTFEVYEGEINREYRLVHQYTDSHVAFDRHGRTIVCGHGHPVGYTNLRKVSP